VSDNFLAAAFSLGTAVSSATFSLIVRRGQKHASAMTGVVIGLVVNAPLLLLATAYLWEPAWWNLEAFLWFTLAGLTGPSLGRVFMYQSIHRLGVARAVPMMATGPLFTAALAVAFLGERPGPLVWAGTFLIMGGCAAITFKRKGDTSWDRRYLWMPLVAVAGFGVSNIFRKLGIDIVPSPLFGITVTSLAGMIFLLALGQFLPAPHRPRLRPGKAWTFYGACGAVNTLAFLLHFYALRYGDLTIVTPLSSTAPLFALVLSALLLRDVERVTGWILAGTVFLVLGSGLIAWGVL